MIKPPWLLYNLLYRYELKNYLSTNIELDIDTLLVTTNVRATDTIEIRAPVRNIKLYASPDGYEPTTASTMIRYCSMNIPEIAGPIDIPTRNKRVVIPIDIPLNCFGTKRVEILKAPTSVKDIPIAIIIRLIVIDML